MIYTVAFSPLHESSDVHITHMHIHTFLQRTLALLACLVYPSLPTDFVCVCVIKVGGRVCTFPWAAACWLGLWLGRASVPSLTVLPVGLRQVIKGWRRRMRSQEKERRRHGQRERGGRGCQKEGRQIRWRKMRRGERGAAVRGSKVLWLSWQRSQQCTQFSRGFKLCMQHKQKRKKKSTPTGPSPHTCRMWCTWIVRSEIKLF